MALRLLCWDQDPNPCSLASLHALQVRALTTYTTVAMLVVFLCRETVRLVCWRCSCATRLCVSCIVGVPVPRDCASFCVGGVLCHETARFVCWRRSCAARLCVLVYWRCSCDIRLVLAVFLCHENARFVCWWCSSATRLRLVCWRCSCATRPRVSCVGRVSRACADEREIR